MWQSTVNEQDARPRTGQLPEPDGNGTPDAGNIEPERGARDETMLGILLRLPATWVR